MHFARRSRNYEHTHHLYKERNEAKRSLSVIQTQGMELALRQATQRTECGVDMGVQDGESCPGCGLANYSGLCPVCRGDYPAYQEELEPYFGTWFPEADEE
jgi:hypothetical protein